jgi:hypothetical protein
MLLSPQTDTARVSILETIVHGIVSVSVIASATVLAALRDLDTTTYSVVIGAGIAASGAVSVLQARASNGKVRGEVIALSQLPGGMRATDPPRIPVVEPRNGET